MFGNWEYLETGNLDRRSCSQTPTGAIPSHHHFEIRHNCPVVAPRRGAGETGLHRSSAIGAAAIGEMLALPPLGPQLSVSNCGENVYTGHEDGTRKAATVDFEKECSRFCTQLTVSL